MPTEESQRGAIQMRRGSYPCRECKHDDGKCVELNRRGTHKHCFEEKQFTNADRIRAMSDEELADFLVGLADDGNLRIRDWLRQPATK